MGIIPAITGKIELVYEGEQEGPYQVAVNLIEKSMRQLFIQYFPNPETSKKRKPTGKKSTEESPVAENPYQSITRWFNNGNHLELLNDLNDQQKIETLYQVEGLYALVKKYYPLANMQENALLMEFVLHGLAAYSLISKKSIDGKISFNDLMGSMMNFGQLESDEEDDF